MNGRTVRLESDDKRWIEWSVKGTRAVARVGDAEPFPFNFENLGFVANGMGYQAWGAGSHFALRPEASSVMLEFQGPHDRSAAVVRLSPERLLKALDELDAHPSSERRATLF